MKAMDKNALEVKGRKRKDSWRVQCQRSDGRVATGRDTGSGKGQPERRRAQPGRGIWKVRGVLGAVSIVAWS